MQQAEAIRSLIFANNFSNLTELLLFSAARHENIIHEIQPSLQKGQFVLCDRFVLSTFVYQGYIKNIDLQIIANIHKTINFDLYPDLTLILDTTTATAITRIGNRHASLLNKIDNMPKEYHDNIIKGFRDYKKFYKAPTCVIAKGLSLYEIHKSIIANINKQLKLELLPLPEKVVQKLSLPKE
ncbi:Thymidylate kinase [Candidatus Hepatincola sp. Av]